MSNNQDDPEKPQHKAVDLKDLSADYSYLDYLIEKKFYRKFNGT